MKKLALLSALLMLALSALATRGLPFNYDCRQATSNVDVRTALKVCADKEPAVQMLYADQFGDSNWNTDVDRLEVVGQQKLEKGRRFRNTSLDQKGRPFQHWSTAKGGEVIVELRSSITMRTTMVKRSCLNVAGVKLKTMPCLREEVVETTNVKQAVNLDLRIDIQLTATATAQTAPINIVINNITPTPQYMVAGGGGQTFFVTSDKQSLVWGGVCWVTPTKINNVNVNKNVNKQSQNQDQSQQQDQSQAQSQSTAIAIDDGSGDSTDCDP